MRRMAWLLVTWFSFATAANAAPPAEAITGTYVSSERDHKIELFLRDGALYGRIAWTKDLKLTDKQNKDPKLRGRRITGIEHIRGFKKARDGSWISGTLYNPENGGSYEARLWLEAPGRPVIQGRPRIPVLGGILGALFGRITYARAVTR